MSHKSTVLIVDDEPIGRETLEALLAKEGYKLVFACDGIEALDRAKEILPDLVLLDIMMPGMNGFEVCRHLRADPFLAEVPVILITTLDDREYTLRGLEAGAEVADKYSESPVIGGGGEERIISWQHALLKDDAGVTQGWA